MNRSFANQIAIVSGSFSILLGGLVLTGWYAHNISLIQVSSNFVPMQYNTALGFLLCGISLLLLVFKRDRWATAIGVESEMGKGSRFYFDLPCT